MIFNFLIVEPATPGNVGSAARAIKTMGFNQLRLINPCNHLCDEARWLAHGSNDILEQATVFPTLNEAITDLDFIVGTTAKRRNAKVDYLPLNQLNNALKSKSSTIKKIGIVFGREESGLTNDELKLCDIVTSVPLKTTYPSLNLAQAIMLYAYELSNLELETQANEFKEAESFKALKKNVSKILTEIGMKEESNIFPRIIERISLLSDTDIHLLHSISNKLNKKYNIK